MAALYHTIDNVKALVNPQQWPVGATPSPSEAQVEVWILETEARVSAALKSRYADLPPTTDESLAILCEICSKFTAARVWRVIFQGKTAPGEVTYADTLDEQAQVLLDALREGTIILPGADYTADVVAGPGTPSATGFDRDPILTMDDEL